jgi:hypothetical protein
MSPRRLLGSGGAHTILCHEEVEQLVGLLVDFRQQGCSSVRAEAPLAPR